MSEQTISQELSKLSGDEQQGLHVSILTLQLDVLQELLASKGIITKEEFQTLFEKRITDALGNSKGSEASGEGSIQP